MAKSADSLVQKLKRDGTITLEFPEAAKLLNYLKKHGPSAFRNYDIYWEVKDNGKITLSL